MATFNQNLYKAIELHYEKHRSVPSVEKLHEITEIPLEQIEEAFDDDDFIQILQASYLYEIYNSAPGDLSLSQLSALHVFGNQHDRRTITQKLKALRITSQQFNRWMQDPTFSRTLNNKVQQAFKENGWQVFQSLLNQAAGGDFNSTKLYMEMNGHYTPSSRNQNLNVDVSVKSVDLLIEVILRTLGPLENGQSLIAQITSGFEEVLTTGKLSPPIPIQVSGAESHSPNILTLPPPVEAHPSSGKMGKIEDFLNTVSQSNELVIEEDDDLGL